MAPAVAGANAAWPATARYGVFLSETLWPAFGVVIVTVGVEAPATPTASAAAVTTAATTSALILLMTIWSSS